MFNKKRCKKCGNSMNEKYEFCPYCGNSLKENSGDWGMLGKEDFISDNEIKLPMGFNKIFNSLIRGLGKELNKEFSNLEKQSKKNGDGIKKSGISIKISTLGDMPPEIRIDSFGDGKKNKLQAEKKIKIPRTTFYNQKEIAKLPKEEPLTDLKRFSNKIVYEIKIPGVKSMKNVSINQLENSIEIKALGKDKVYFKLIPINLPIKKYNLSQGRLILEFEEN